MGCPRDGSIEAEGSGMGEAVQHIRAPADLMDGPAVFLLVQEKARLLAVLHIHDVADAVFRDGDLRFKRLSQEALEALQTFLFADFGIRSFIDASDLYAVLCQDFCQGLQYDPLDLFHSQSQGLGHQDVFVLVYGKTRQEIRLAEDDPAGGGINDFLPVVPGGPDPPFQEGSGDLFRLFPGQDPDPDPGAEVDKAIAQKVAVEVFYGEDVSVFKIAFDPVDLIVIDPEAAGLEGPSFLFLQDRPGGCAEVLLPGGVKFSI